MLRTALWRVVYETRGDWHASACCVTSKMDFSGVPALAGPCWQLADDVLWERLAAQCEADAEFVVGKILGACRGACRREHPFGCVLGEKVCCQYRFLEGN